MFWDHLELRAQLQAFSTFQHDEKLMAFPQFVLSDGSYPAPFTFPARSERESPYSMSHIICQTCREDVVPYYDDILIQCRDHTPMTNEFT